MSSATAPPEGRPVLGAQVVRVAKLREAAGRVLAGEARERGGLAAGAKA